MPVKPLAALILALAMPGLVAGSDWKDLFDGRSLTGWEPTSAANWRVENGAIVVDSGERGFLIHEGRYRNYELTVRFKAARGANSGVFLNTKRGRLNLAEDCYELNIAPPDNPFPTGSLVARTKVEGAGESDDWRRFDVRVQGGRVIVRLDGRQVLDYRGAKPATGNLIALQMNEGRVAFRDIRVRLLE
jgi:hypothetical protein